MAVADAVLYRNANIITLDRDRSTVGAFLVDNGRFIAVGVDDASRAADSIAYREVDLEGLTVLPGFIDSHNHVFEGASEIGGDCLLSPDDLIIDQNAELSDCASHTRPDGRWIIGYGHQLENIDTGDTLLTPRGFLDQYFPDNPVIIMEESSHSMLVNSAALSQSGIDVDRADPQGGVIARDSQGIPNGILFDNAGDIVMELAWNQVLDRDRLSYDGLLAGMSAASRFGITTIGDGRLYWRRGWYEVWKDAERKGDLTVRVSLRPWIYPHVPLDQQIDAVRRFANDERSDLLPLSQVKLYVDGVMHFGTAKMLEPYKWSWQENLPFGLNYVSPQQLTQLLRELEKLGIGAHIHAVGDGGVREALDAISTLRDEDSTVIYSLTHLELIADSDISRFAELDVHADFQVGATYFDQTAWAGDYIGSDRARRMFPIRQVFESGANVTFSSDWTVNALNPMVAIANSIRLQAGKGLPTVLDALEAATINGARALGIQRETGSIETGKSADFVVLDIDPLTADPDEIEFARPIMTVLQGEVVYQDGGRTLQ